MLLNLPSSGLISTESDGASLTWSKTRPRVISLGRTDASTQVLKPADPTDALVACIKSKKIQSVNQKRPREENINQGSIHAAKRPNSLAAGLNPSGTSIGISAAAAVAVRVQQPQASAAPNRSSNPPPLAPRTSIPDRKANYSLDDLRSRNIKQLQDILRSKSLAVSGTKDQMIQRIIDYQRREKIAQQGR